MSSPTPPGVMMHPTSVASFMSPFPTLFDAERLIAPPYGFNPPTTQSPFTGARPEPVLQGGTVTQSFTQTSYSAGGVQTTYSVSTVSRPNDEGGVDVYRTRKTTVRALRKEVYASRISVFTAPFVVATGSGWNQLHRLPSGEKAAEAPR